jgi:salicylate hydroxylase
MIVSQCDGPSKLGLIHGVRQIPVESLQHIPEIRRCVSAKEPWTTMVMAHSCRVIMGPCRNGELLSIVALVPDGEESVWRRFVFHV